MILHTGGLAAGDTSTRSNPSSSAALRASLILITPNYLPVLEITRTSLAVICSFVRGPELFFALKLIAKTNQNICK